MAKAQHALPDPEALLLDYAERLAHRRAGRRALFVALSRLTPPLRPDDHWRVVENLVHPLVLRHGGEVFRLRNGDAMVVFLSVDQALADRVTVKLRVLFRDDPLIAAETRGAPAAFARWFDLKRDYDAFLALARALKEERTSAPGDESAAALAGDDLSGLIAQRPPLRTNPAHAPLMRWLRSGPRGAAALSGLAARNPAVRRRPQESPALAFEHFTPHLEGLIALGLPRGDLERNPALEAALLGLSARRLLSELPLAYKGDQALGVSLGLDSVLSTEFLSFHQAFALGRWVPVTTLIPYGEAAGDVKRYRYVRDHLRGLGHRVGLAGLPLHSFRETGAANPARLDADLLAFDWDARYAHSQASADIAVLRAWLDERRGQDVLLSNADAREALQFGQALGITLFMGRQAAALLGR